MHPGVQKDYELAPDRLQLIQRSCIPAKPGERLLVDTSVEVAYATHQPRVYEWVRRAVCFTPGPVGLISRIGSYLRYLLLSGNGVFTDLACPVVDKAVRERILYRGLFQRGEDEGVIPRAVHR